MLDEKANAAFFTGLMAALPAEYCDIGKSMAYDDAKDNFCAAARHGLKAQLTWAGGKTQAARAHPRTPPAAGARGAEGLRH